MVRCKILKIFFLLYIAKYRCTFCCNRYCTWGTPLVFNINHYKPKNMICSWNWNTEYSSQAGGFLKCLLNNTLVSELIIFISSSGSSLIYKCSFPFTLLNSFFCCTLADLLVKIQNSFLMRKICRYIRKKRKNNASNFSFFILIWKYFKIGSGKSLDHFSHTKI